MWRNTSASWPRPWPIQQIINKPAKARDGSPSLAFVRRKETPDLKRILKYLLSLAAVALALTLCPAVSAAAEPAPDIEWCEVMEDGTVVYYTGDPSAALMAEEEQDPSLPQLSAPTNLEWGKYYPSISTLKEDGSQDTTSREVPGMASWAQGAPNEALKDQSQIQFLIQYFKQGQEGDTLIAKAPVICKQIREGFISSNEAFLLNVRETGDYYFTVTAMGDGTTCRDSEPVRSEIWHFEDPGLRLSAPTSAPVWAAAPNADGDPVVSFVRSDDPQVLIHRLRYYYTSGPNAKTEIPGTALLYNNASSYKLSADMRQRFGPGYYGASVRYLSRDITKIQCSEESSASSALYISKFYGKTLDEIMGLVSSDSPKKDIQDAVDAVRKMNAAKLAADMWDDQSNEGAAGQIKTLEELAGTAVQVDVCKALSEVIDKTKVTMIGAGLNAAPGQSVTLKIGESDEETGVLPVMYDVVPFSIRLTNGEGNDLPLRNGELAVPVKLTLPISKSISLNSLTIRHTCPDGTVEELSANRGLTITWSRDKAEPNYVTFMVRSPGSYIMEARTDLFPRPTEGGISVELKVNPRGRDLTAALAVFDGSGKLLGVSLVPVNSENDPG